LDRIDFHQHDRFDSFPDGTFDLASAQFLHSTVRLARTQILRNAARAAVPGSLLVDRRPRCSPNWIFLPGSPGRRGRPGVAIRGSTRDLAATRAELAHDVVRTSKT